MTTGSSDGVSHVVAAYVAEKLCTCYVLDLLQKLCVKSTNSLYADLVPLRTKHWVGFSLHISKCCQRIRGDKRPTHQCRQYSIRRILGNDSCPEVCARRGTARLL